MDNTLAAVLVTVGVALFVLTFVLLVRFFARPTHSGGPNKRDLAANRAEIEAWRDEFPRRD